MNARPGRKWAEIQVDLFRDAVRRHATSGACARFEALFACLVPPVRPATGPRDADRRDEPRAAAGKTRDPD